VIYRLGVLVFSYQEDIHGAVAAGQLDVAVRACRDVAEECALIWLLAAEHVRPLPEAAHRAAAARNATSLDARADVDLLLRGVDPNDSAGVEQLVSAAERLISRTKALLGKDVPNILTPEGYFPALKFGADWIRLVNQLNEEDFLPEHWKPE
jgi:hypothetical protein